MPLKPEEKHRKPLFILVPTAVAYSVKVGYIDREQPKI